MQGHEAFENAQGHGERAHRYRKPHLRPFVEGEIEFVGYTDQHDKLQAMLTLNKRKNIEIGLDKITGLILASFIRNTSSLMDVGQEYK